MSGVSSRLSTGSLAVCAALVACNDGTSTTSTSGASTAAAGSTSSTGAGAGGGGGGLEGPTDAWAWNPVDATKCGNGTPAGVAVNLHPASTDLLVLVSGGGACWDDEMCNGAAPASVHLHEALTEETVALEYPQLSRSDPNNPLSSATWAYVPYCTGDIHWGDRTATYAGGAIEHRGASNLRTILERLRATRPETKRIWLFGGSAGGYGVTLHWGTAKQTFGDGVEVHVLADASPLVLPKGDRWDKMKQAWNIQFPPGCAGCAADPGAMLDTLAAAYPTSRHGFLVFDDDAVISDYFGYTGDLPAAIDGLLATHHDPHPNTKYFVAPGTGHGVVGQDVTAPDMSTPGTFVVQWLLGDPAWHSVAF